MRKAYEDALFCPHGYKKADSAATRLDSFIDTMNAEIEHYRQILARKGVITGSSNNSGQGGSDQQGGTVTPDPVNPDPSDGGGGSGGDGPIED